MQSRGRFVKNKKSTGRILRLEVSGELQTLGFSARKCVDGLPQADVSQTHFHKRLERSFNLCLVIKKDKRLIDGHGKNFVNILSLVPDG